MVRLLVLAATLVLATARGSEAGAYEEKPLDAGVFPARRGGDGGGDPTPLAAAAGHYKLGGTHDGHMFSLFFASRGAKDAPLVLWLTGGPGCSSELAVFYENGPYHLQKDATGAVAAAINEDGWDQTSNLLFVDSPLDTGFSYTRNPLDMVHDEKGVAKDLHAFFMAFLEAHPELRDLDVYVTGESYGGHYVPAVTYKLMTANQEGEGQYKVNIKGMAIGNGLTEPGIQYAAYGDYALENGLISNATYDQVQAMLPDCQAAIAKCKTSPPAALRDLGADNGIFSHPCLSAVTVCQAIPSTILQAAGDINVYDIRKECTYKPLCYDFSNADTFLNAPSTQSALGVNRPWKSCSNVVHSAMMGDWMHNLETVVPPILAGNLRVLIYAGADDFICNYLGNYRWVSEMDWPGKDKFNAQQMSDFQVAGSVAGHGKEQDNLAFLRVESAGHMVPMDQPAASLEMLRRFVTGEPIFPPQLTTKLGRKGGAAAEA